MGDRNTMRRNDKLIVLLGVIILILASISIYFWSPVFSSADVANVDDICGVTGIFIRKPTGITVSDSCPFYPLIATPLVVNYDENNVQYIKPLYIKNSTDASKAISRAELQVGIHSDEFIDGLKSPKECSLYLTKKYWQKSDAVLLIKYDQEGYELGVVATPIASYLSIPVIVTDKVDQDVREVLEDLDVKYSLVCGNLTGYGKLIEFSNIDDIVNASISIIRQKFENDPQYITIANPRDAWTPTVMDVTNKFYEGTLESGSLLPSQFLTAIQEKKEIIKFTIPEDYKYALVKIELRSLEDFPENIDKFGDHITVQGSIVGFAQSVASPAKRDLNGNPEYDRFYYETVLYDMGGEEFDIKFSASFHTVDSAKYKLFITIEQLSDPYYPLMKGLSSTAPYLTAFHKGIIFAKPEFAFAADDDVVLDGNTLPGNTQVMKNPILIPLLNRHVFDNIHKPLNELLANIRGIDISNEKGVESLTKDCKLDPFYVAIVGDATMLPQYYYRSPHNDPFNKRDTMYGTGCPSDFIYGNIDPETYFMQPYIGKDDVENDKYSKYPEVENIVGRITGWDIQDVSALIARTIFYDNVIDQLGEWKDNAVVMSGAGLEFQKLPFFNTVYNVLEKHEPMKFPTGEQHFLNMRTSENVEKGDFNVEIAERGKAQRVGYTDEALWEIKQDGLLNLILFPRWLVKLAQGFESVNSLISLDWWKEALSDQSGIKGGELQESSNLILSNSHGIWFGFEHGDSMMYLLGGPPILYQLIGRFFPVVRRFATPLDSVGAYNVRSVSNMELGPSVMFVEGCGCGKIDSLHPTTTVANAYIHSGVNAYISPTTYSAIGGYLEPRPKWPLLDDGVGLGILGYLNALINAGRGVYPDVHFCGVIFEDSYEQLIEKNVDIGTALRNAKNDFLPEEISKKYLWTPPLGEHLDSVPTYTLTSSQRGDEVIIEKYCTIYQLNLLGDPAFNPYEPCNEGS
jgi:hypothetical protein